MKSPSFPLPPGPRGRFFLGNLRELKKNPLELITGNARKYGDIVHMQVADIHIYQLNNPDLIEEVLVTKNKSFKKPRLLQDTRGLLGNGLLTSDGEVWLRQRRLIQPAFHQSRIK